MEQVRISKYAFAVPIEIHTELKKTLPAGITLQIWTKNILMEGLRYLEAGGEVDYSYKFNKLYFFKSKYLTTYTSFTNIIVPKNLAKMILEYKPDNMKQYYFVSCLIKTILSKKSNGGCHET